MSMSTSNLDYAATRQGCVPPVCEVHLPNYLLSVQMHTDKVEVYTSVQVHMREVAGVEQFPIGVLVIFLLNALFKGFVSSSCVNIDN